ncbi:hypothetical protein PG994_002482 [Apiospora phragmitis]|uniref:Uncharacterized protein n=1 Tax=Apiospora phragmitis TaxID=2905665 RepID=A0ABR1WWJ8_9PEZI
MFTRTTALRSSVCAARMNRSCIPPRSMRARNYATEPEPTPKEGGVTKDAGSIARVIAGVACVGIAGTFALLLGNPRKAKEVGPPQVQPQPDHPYVKANAPLQSRKPGRTGE